MKSISIFPLFLFILLNSCTSDNSEVLVDAIEPEQTIDRNTYMLESYGQNANCMEDYMYLDIDGQIIEYYYNDPNGGIQLCNFNEGNVSGAICDNCEGHSASLPLPVSYYSYFPGLPVEVGGDYPFLNGIEPITDININGLNISFLIPGILTDNLAIGNYRVNNDSQDPGARILINWSLHFAGGSTGFTLYIDTSRPHKIDLECIDRSNPDYIQLTGNFEGIFTGQDLNNPTQIGYEIPISGKFSYKITL